MISNDNVEYWDLFDVNRKIICNNHIRGNKIPDGLYHLVIHVWIMDDKGRFLVSKRQINKSDANMWERTGGSAIAGETSVEGAIREANEELGIDLSNVPPHFIKSQKREKYHDFFDSWLFVIPSDTKVRIDESEVADYMWASIDEMRDLEKDGKLVKSSLYYMEVYKVFKKMV